MLFSWDYLLQGFITVCTLQNLLWATVGCLIGTVIGVLPGIGPPSGIAILLAFLSIGRGIWIQKPVRLRLPWRTQKHKRIFVLPILRSVE